MKKLILLFIVLQSVSSFSQDSTKTISHEIGFNTVALVKQLISNSPNSVLPQLPYLIIYNLNTKDIGSLRIGFGMTQFKTSTRVTGLTEPRSTSQLKADVRLGYGKEFFEFKHFTANAFVDGVFGMDNTSTITTATTNTGGFPQTVATIKTETSSETKSIGGQLGFGLKYAINKRILLYTECPVQFLMSTTKTTDRTAFPGFLDVQFQDTETIGTKIFIPTTVYLLIKF